MCTLDYYKELVDELDDIIRVKSKSGRIYKNLGKSLRTCAQLRKIAGYVICPDEPTWRCIQMALGAERTQTHHFSHGGNDTRLVVFRT